MSFDSNGVFTRVMNWTSDQQNGIAIECGRHDQEDDNFAQGFNDTFCRDGRAAATGDFNLGSHKIKNLAAGTTSTDAVNKGQMETALATKANTADVVNLTGTQTITGNKTFNGTVSLPAGVIVKKQDNNLEGGQINFQKADNDPLSQDPIIDLYNGEIRFIYCNAVQVPNISYSDNSLKSTNSSWVKNTCSPYVGGSVVEVNKAANTQFTAPSRGILYINQYSSSHNTITITVGSGSLVVDTDGYGWTMTALPMASGENAQWNKTADAAYFWSAWR